MSCSAKFVYVRETDEYAIRYGMQREIKIQTPKDNNTQMSSFSTFQWTILCAKAGNLPKYSFSNWVATLGRVTWRRAHNETLSSGWVCSLTALRGRDVAVTTLGVFNRLNSSPLYPIISRRIVSDYIPSSYTLSQLRSPYPIPHHHIPFYTALWYAVLSVSHSIFTGYIYSVLFEVHTTPSDRCELISFA